MHTFSQDTKERKGKERNVCLFKMLTESENRNSVVESEVAHRCSLSCLGPLSFHRQAVGDKVRLSEGCRLAERTGDTFKNGLVFSNRPVKLQERIRLRVEKDLSNWHGVLRVGFTNVPPEDRRLPLPVMAIPNLTDTPGHWAAPVHESYCQAGTELEFWVSCAGSVFVTSNDTRQCKLLVGVDLSQPLWAMIDIYGQTCSIFLLGSEKRGFLFSRRSCPAPERVTSPDVDNHSSLVPDGDSDDRLSCLNLDIPADEGRVLDCVVCMRQQARVTLPCGHQCLCRRCVFRVVKQFGCCPLCRHHITAPSAEGSCDTGVL